MRPVAVPGILLAVSFAAASLLSSSLVRADDFFIVPVPVGSEGTVPVADVVELRALGTAALIEVGSRIDLRRGGNDGRNGSSDFVVPAGRVFVMTSIMVSPADVDNGFNALELLQRNNGTLRVRRQIIVRADSTKQQSFTPGIIFAAGSELSVRNLANGVSDVRVDVTGYLADAR